MTARGVASIVGLVVVYGCGSGLPPPAVGTLERDRLELVAEQSEPVLERPVEEGTYVDAGALLVRLDSTRERARVARASGARERAKARVAELMRGPRPERIDEARARLSGAQGRLAIAERDLERARELFGRRVVSREELDRREAGFTEAQAARDEASAALEAMLAGTTEEELAQAQAALAEADAVLAEAKVRLARLDVRAPTSGWLDALPYELGEQPPVGGVVAVLLAAERPYARVYVPAVVRSHVRPGSRAEVRIDGLDRPLDGRVRTVAREASFTPYFALTERDRGRLVYLAKVDLVDAPARELPTGIPVEAEFPPEPPRVEHAHAEIGS